MLFTGVRKIIITWLAHLVAGDVEIKAIGLRVVLAALHVMSLKVPFADVGGGVASILESLGQGDLLGRHVTDHFRWSEHVIWPHGAARTTVISEANATGILTSENTGACG